MSSKNCRFVINFLLAFAGFSFVLAAYWGIYFLAVGNVPRGYWGISRWFDLLIQPVWLVVFLFAMNTVMESEHPQWSVVAAMIAWGLWFLGGILSVFFGLAFLVPVAIVIIVYWFAIHAVALVFVAVKKGKPA